MAKFEITRKQQKFISAKADEVLFGGAAGGGKSYGQLIDAFLYALKYSNSKQIMFRRTFPDLERSLILTSLGLYDPSVATYNASTHRWKFLNGSTIEFAYCASEMDLTNYQGAEYDCIRFDELTHFPESIYTYMFSRCRGTNGYPKQVKSTTNPGGIGHSWVKERFIDVGPPNKAHKIERKDGSSGTRLFIPSLVQDNIFLMQRDPGYIGRLQVLEEKDKRALLYGDWDAMEGQYFTSFKRDIHVVEPFRLDPSWRRYVTLDYGLDMLAAYCVALTNENVAYVYKEVYEPNLIVSAAAQKILGMVGDDFIDQYLAPPDLWNRRQETGKSVADIFSEHGIDLSRTSNDRVDGWMAVHEWLRPKEDEQGIVTSALKIFSTCVNLIRTLPALQHDPRNPNDTMREPHELTHAPDSLRGFCVYHTSPNAIEAPKVEPMSPFHIKRDYGPERIMVI